MSRINSASWAFQSRTSSDLHDEAESAVSLKIPTESIIRGNAPKHYHIEMHSSSRAFPATRALGSNLRSAVRVGDIRGCRRSKRVVIMASSKPLVVVGSANVDLVFSCDRLPLPGETMAAASLETFPGGKVRSSCSQALMIPL